MFRSTILLSALSLCSARHIPLPSRCGSGWTQGESEEFNVCVGVKGYEPWASDMENEGNENGVEIYEYFKSVYFYE